MISDMLKPLLLALSFFSLAAGSGEALAKPKVVTTFTIIADMARNVAGDAADVESITKAGAEIHNYQPTPQDIYRSLDADLVLRNGLNLELWFEKFLTNLGDVPNVVVTDGVEPMSIVEGPYEGKPNPHAWMSPANALIYIENIRKGLTSIDPDNAEIYAANAKAYGEKITALSTEIRDSIATLPENKRWLVTSEGAFSYLTRDFGLKELFLWPINADQQGTPKQVKAVIDAVREHNIHVVFSESTVSSKPAEQVAAETGARYGGVLYVDSLSEADGPVPTYLDLLRVTSETIVEGLTK
ncbi:metal ABC transporter substrate-binding protein [Sinorhizobium sp. BG8]|uniref:metal ABC transporter substrate-binding protein n=1 Tax=Sinorhizobium sp. BG8 TaxID=2613773 RepID=UPI00193E74EB|nr:metal ABC transporter substrate-binding protein [Sinorhizobium sp. BG8]QRM53167.1 metal ABC transporter substrate-binding protein [Sinorhizobium sp. BG8]